jgi:hypothetical protein
MTQDTEQTWEGTKSIQKVETATTALASREQARVQAKAIVAMRSPRDLDTVRVRILKECSRPGFADTARYSKPVGGQRIEGPSIRFAEAAVRLMGNIDIDTQTIEDDEDKRVLRVCVSDLETNAHYASEITIEKTVERKRLGRGEQPISQRVNSAGEVVYLVRPTEDALLNKQQALVSKAIRTNALRLLPGDIVEEAMVRVLETQRKQGAADPDAARKRLVDSFAAIGVAPAELAKYLGHPIDQIVPAELVDLRGVYAAIKDGETTWKAVCEKDEEPPKPASNAKEKLQQKLKREVVEAPPQEPYERQPGEDL